MESAAAVEGIQHELVFHVAADQRPGVAVHAQNRRGNFRAALPDNQPPGVLALGALNRDVPEPAYVRSLGSASRRLLMGSRLKVMQSGACAAILPGQHAVFQNCVQVSGVVIEAQMQRAAAEAAAGGGDALLPVKQGAVGVAALSVQLDREGNRDFVPSDGGVPEAADRLSAYSGRTGAEHGYGEEISNPHGDLPFLHGD